jgi:hypothetical protein
MVIELMGIPALSTSNARSRPDFQRYQRQVFPIASEMERPIHLKTKVESKFKMIKTFFVMNRG